MFEDEGPPTPAWTTRQAAGRSGCSKTSTRGQRPETPDWHYDEVAACFREGRAVMSTDWPGGFYVPGSRPEHRSRPLRRGALPRRAGRAPHLLELAPSPSLSPSATVRPLSSSSAS